MNEKYQVILKMAVSKKKENKRFLEKLKGKKVQDLDQITNQLHDEVFETIECLQCANCCKTTGPLLKPRDVQRLADHQRMRSADFTETFLRVDEDGDYVFKSMPCPFLKTDHYCSVYESRPNACREYPHTQQKDIRQKLAITFQNTMICPGVAMIVERLKKVVG